MSKFSLSSLRSRAIVLVLLAIFPLLALTLYSYLDQRDRVIREVQRDELVTVRNLATIQETLLNKTRQLLMTLAQLPQVQRRDRDACNTIFAALMEQSPHSASIGATDSEGRLFASAPAAAGPVNYADRPWFQKIIQTRDFVIGETVLGRISGKYGNILAFPILDGDGRFLGALPTQLNLHWLGNLLAKSNLPTTTAMVLTDSTYKVLFRYPEPQEYIGKIVPDFLVKAMTISDEGVAAGVGLPGDARLFAFTRLSPPWQEMRLIIGLPQDWAVSPVNRILWRNLIWLGLVAIFAMAAAWFGGDLFIVRPVKKLRAVTQRLAAGDLSVRAGPDFAGGEVGLMGQAFDQMADSLQEREEALRQSEEHYRSLFDNMLNGYVQCRMLYEEGRPVDFIYLTVNHAFELLTGLTEVQGKKFSEVIPGLSKVDLQLLETFGKVALTGIPEQFEVHVEALDMWFWVSVYSQEKEHFVAIFDVITERKRAEEALRESREDLNRAQAVAQTGSWRMNVQRNELTWSDENHRIFGIPPGTPMTYETFLGTVYLEDREYVNREWMAALRGEPYDIEHRIIVDGTVKWVRERAELEFDSEGQLLGGFGTTQDFTERKQAEAEIKRLASFPQMNPSPVLEIDATGAITFYNRASVKALEKLGPEAELSDLLPKDIGEIAATARQKKEQVFYREVEIRDAVFGQTIFFSEALDVLRIYSMDITQRKRAEEALRERTSQLEFANREMESFSYSVSHDLKAPLRAIQGFSRMLVGEHAAQLNTEGLRLLNVITSNTKLMAALIDDLLALSRWGRHEIRKGSINLTAMARQVFKQLKSQEPERDLQFIIEDLPPAQGDPSLIKQVMVNLLTNAVKYTKPRKTAVIEVGGKDEEKVTIYYVKDNGIGFDERYADKLFGVFQRLHSDEEYEGTGVGLAIVKRIIERHDGRVWAEGKVDEGATFYFTLPKNGA